MRPLAFLILGLALSTTAPAQTGEVARIIDEGMNRSQVALTAHELVDGIGARLTNSPRMRQAEAWAVRRFEALGLSNVRKEGFTFGRGWEIVDSEVEMTAPRRLELTAIPVAWTPGTNGPLEAPVIVAPIEEKQDFAAYRGKLRGKIVMISLPGTGDEPDKPAFRRLTASELSDLDNYPVPSFDPDALGETIKRSAFARELDEFLAAEGALAWARISYRDGKLVHGAGYRFGRSDTPKLPGIEIAAEDYRRLARLAKTGPAPVLKVDSRVRWSDEDPNAYNILADIPGSDARAGYVMAGAHFDSWAAGDGAVDNGAGSVVVMEAARILRTLGRPKRTIRFALWGAEEQGLIGSLNYIDRHFASRGNFDLSSSEGRARWRYAYPVTPRPDHGQLKAYFNMDNGSGRFRGIYAEGNSAAAKLLGQWLQPFAAMDADRVVARSTGGTDHVYMQAVGLPAFQFVQDPLDYSARLHHTNIDTFDHLRIDDLRQAAVVMAGMLWQAANSDETLPRQPVPAQPAVTDPFKYEYPKED